MSKNSVKNISLFVTGNCNLQCIDCIMGGVRRSDPNYEISCEELEDFIEITSQSGYEFTFTISGGEPSLWSNLQSGVKLLRESKICRGIEIFTNALDIDVLNNDVVDCLDGIRISTYHYHNEQTTKELKRRFGKKVKTVPREQFYPIPPKPLPGVTPANCVYNKWWYYKRGIYCCAHCLSLYHNSPYPLCNRLVTDYETGLPEIKEKLIKDPKGACGRCAANLRFRNVSKKVTNFSQMAF